MVLVSLGLVHTLLPPIKPVVACGVLASLMQGELPCRDKKIGKLPQRSSMIVNSELGVHEEVGSRAGGRPTRLPACALQSSTEPKGKCWHGGALASMGNKRQAFEEGHDAWGE